MGTPRVLFETPFSDDLFFDVTRDGQRFVWIWPDEEAASLPGRQLNVVLNWFEELNRLVPTN